MRLSWIASLVLVPGLSAATVEFDRDVRPLLEKHCIECHGPKKQKSGYRLDSRDVALAGGDSGESAILPGDADASPLIRFVSGADKEMFMPPKKSDTTPLTSAQIATLRQWISEGALWSENVREGKTHNAKTTNHWSFQPLQRPEVPGNEINPIDSFIRAKLRKQGFAPSPEADKRTLIRRLYFDLVGLPPSAEEVDTFCSDTDPQAYEKIVDRLLASPRYGERWARHWLDVVHYGDTHGYDKDKPRENAWPYRDYVIRAFNEDKPYSRFVEEQIAGDVLFPDTVDGITALGFIAAGPWDLIGHTEVPETKIDGKIARHLDRDDMVANTISTFQSVTVHCAQCHDHKFDPVPQEDYYALQAVFAALDRADKPYFADPSIAQHHAGLQQEKRRVGAIVKQFDADVAKATGGKLAELDRRIDAAMKGTGNAVPQFGYHSAIAAKQDEEKWVQVDLGGSVEIDRIVLLPSYDEFGGIGAGFGFPVRFKVELSDDPVFKQGVTLLEERNDETFLRDFPNPGVAPFTTGGLKDGVRARYVRVTSTKLAPRTNDFIFALAELQVFDKSGKNVAAKAQVTALDSIEAAPRWAKMNLVDGHAPVQPDAGAAGIAGLRAERTSLLESTVPEERRREHAAATTELARIDAELKRLPQPQMVYAGTVYDGSGAFAGTGPTGGKPRKIAVLARGDVRNPGKEVAPGALSLVTALPARFELASDATEGDRRAALAHWLTDSRNPLTWRSIVNRVWQYHFGRGIVETANDFGKMGAMPTHPELLDWLAVTFRDDLGGSLKRLHRLIVTSATYRQSASPSDDTMHHFAELDASNTLLWRQNRRRLEAEVIRDSMLAVAGKLDLTMGGPGFQDFVITRPEHSPHYEYHLADPEDPKLHRRSIYRFIVRSQQQPWMATMDCADPSMSVEKRNETITPLQALAQLNSSLSVTLAKHFASRIINLAPDSTGQVNAAFRLAFQRAPTDTERDALVAYIERHGLANTCRILLNMSEFFFVD